MENYLEKVTCCLCNRSEITTTTENHGGWSYGHVSVFMDLHPAKWSSYPNPVWRCPMCRLKQNQERKDARKATQEATDISSS